MGGNVLLIDNFCINLELSLKSEKRIHWRSEDENGLGVCVEEPLVQGQEQHETEEHPGSREEVPDVVVVVKSEYLALLVRVPRLGR